MPDFIRQGASVTATVLEAAAGQLRKLSDAEEQEKETATEETPAAPKAETKADAPVKTQAKARTKPRPAPATRSRIANPKAAKKVRSREG